LSKKGTVDFLGRSYVNLEQRRRIYSAIVRTEALLNYAIINSDKGEEDRLRRELAMLVGLVE